jgi:drug/metabolite transporter (DMT)-like permease
MDLGSEAGRPGRVDRHRMLLPVVCSASASVITGIALVVTRFVVEQADPLTIATLRYMLAAACLVPLVPAFHRFNVSLADVIPIAGLGILYFGLFPWCITAAMQYTSASQGAIVLASTPALTLLVAWLRGVEALSFRKALGVALGLLGAAVALGGGEAIGSDSEWLGNGLMAFATLCGAVYAVFSKPFLSKYPALTVTALAMAAGGTTLAVLWSLTVAAHGVPTLDGAGWLAILYIGIAGGALSFFLYAWALGRTAATATMIFLPLNPIAALTAGALWLDEPLSAGLFAGLALVVCGIALVIGPGDTATAAQAAVEIPKP